MQFEKAREVALEKYPKKYEGIIKYGTAGFRTKADILDFVMYRMGLLASLRSCHQKACIGVMITASHNPVPDNGVKLIDPRGEMLAMEWEGYATSLVNCSDEELPAMLESIATETGLDRTFFPSIFVGRDTRPSSDRLRQAVVDGASVLGTRVQDFGVVSTPVLHFVVTCENDGQSYGQPTEEGYLQKLTNAFIQLRKMMPIEKKQRYKPSIFFDGANGVGAIVMAKMIPLIKEHIDIQIFNSGDGVLNSMCGADYVKTTQSWPAGVPSSENQKRCASMDGDADRIMYSYRDQNGKFVMLDGDKIATLVAGYLKSLVDKVGIEVKLGLVQTAYANGASTDYIVNKLGVPVACAKTGVKYLHEEALQYDVGIYFEANGHGTIIFSEKARNLIREKAKDANNAAAQELICAMNLINETVGDAISDMLLVETVLCTNDWSEEDWNNAYTDLPNQLMKVSVKDRAVITTTNAERTCVTPDNLQETINSIVRKYTAGRSFVRPSGTEDVVRVYAEADTAEHTKSIALEVAQAVFDLAGGVGKAPKL